MGDAEVITSVWRQVEVGRIVLITRGEHRNKLAAIVEIVDHKRVLLDNPTLHNNRPLLPRQSMPLAHVTLTGIVIPKFPRAAGTGPLRKSWEAHKVSEKWEASAWAQTKGRLDRRRELSDFERFKVMRLKKQRRYEVQKSLASVRASAKA
ncbi:MAG: hypothetical protein Q9162_003094 [Coniocarpon cinnabarinum]